MNLKRSVPSTPTAIPRHSWCSYRGIVCGMNMAQSMSGRPQTNALRISPRKLLEVFNSEWLCIYIFVYSERAESICAGARRWSDVRRSHVSSAPVGGVSWMGSRRSDRDQGLWHWRRRKNVSLASTGERGKVAPTSDCFTLLFFGGNFEQTSFGIALRSITFAIRRRLNPDQMI